MRPSSRPLARAALWSDLVGVLRAVFLVAAFEVLVAISHCATPVSTGGGIQRDSPRRLLNTSLSGASRICLGWSQTEAVPMAAGSLSTDGPSHFADGPLGRSFTISASSSVRLNSAILLPIKARAPSDDRCTCRHHYCYWYCLGKSYSTISRQQM